jgi:hydroxypyruvate reductase
MLEKVKGLGPDDLVLALISGGGSSSLSLRRRPHRKTNRRLTALLQAGVDWRDELCANIFRRRGGRLAAAAYPARLALSCYRLPGMIRHHHQVQPCLTTNVC